jgi:hypothetical protein
MDGLIGKTLGPYKVLEKIGEGGMAVVYKGYQESLGRHVAIKVLRGELAHDPEFIARFRREALSVAKLSHPNILHVYDAGVVHSVYYIVMDYVEGGSLKDLIAEGPLDVERAVSITAQLAEALEYAHRLGLVHRDIKPSNILLAPDPVTEGHVRPLLTDFGIARVLYEGTRLTRTGASIGTPEYMAPEQAEGEPSDGRTDIYALGIVLYEMLTSRVPFSAPTPAATLYKQVHTPPPPLRQVDAGIPTWLEAVVDKALAKQPEHRFQRAGELARALRQRLAPSAHPAVTAEPPEPLPSTQQPAALPTTRPPRPAAQKRPRQRNRTIPLLVTASVVVFLAVAAAGAYLLWGGTGEGPVTELPSPATTVALQPAGQAPEVTITRPQGQITVPSGEEIAIQSRSIDDEGVVRVELWVDGERIRVDASPMSTGQTPYVVVQPWRAEGAGRHVITIRAYDAQGHVGDSSPLIVNVETAGQPEPTATSASPPTESPPTEAPTHTPSPQPDFPPEIRIVSPASPHRVFPGTVVPVRVVATDDIGVEMILLLVNGAVHQEIGVDPGREVQWTLEWGTDEPGDYRLEVVALDGEAQESPPARLQVNVEPPPEIPPPYGPIWWALDGFQSGLGVPVGEPVERFYAGQTFQHGLMIWRDNAGAADNWIYAIRWGPGADQEAGPAWARFTDTWMEGDPEYSCPDATPPIGPKRGFGRVWCQEPQARELLGLPLEEEWGAGGGWLDFEHGVMLWDARNGRVFVLFEDGHWVALPD